ncbi:MAG: hypothetical protein LBS12_04780 [Prevotellaceae bacterium]|nr:hypothetical protein [Prevotellaceae bacterium]
MTDRSCFVYDIAGSVPTAVYIHFASLFARASGELFLVVSPDELLQQGVG